MRNRIRWTPYVTDNGTVSWKASLSSYHRYHHHKPTRTAPDAPKHTHEDHGRKDAERRLAYANNR